jgi:hypothetical protein
MTWGKSGWGKDNHRPAGQWRVPVEMQTMPLTLKRAHLYPRNPALVAQGIAEYQAAQGQPPVEYLPQRMVNQRYKLSPAPRHPLASVYSVMAAASNGSGSRAVVARLAAHPSQMSLEDATAATFQNSLPTDYGQPYQQFTSRGLPRFDKVTIPQEYNETPVASRVADQQEAINKAHARERALSEVASGLAGVRSRFSGGRR